MSETDSPVLCLLDDAVILHDPRCLGLMQAMLAADAAAATAGCALFHVAPAQTGRGRAGAAPDPRLVAAGLFPGTVALGGAPRLLPAALDCLQALPAATYPVLANRLSPCLVRRRALAEVAPAGLGAGEAAELAFALDAAAAGWRHLCTTRVRAGTTIPPPAATEDPFGRACALPAAWHRLAATVTGLRRLRG